MTFALRKSLAVRVNVVGMEMDWRVGMGGSIDAYTGFIHCLGENIGDTSIALDLKDRG
jgi:hypothetical protein